VAINQQFKPETSVDTFGGRSELVKQELKKKRKKERIGGGRRT